MQEDITIRIKQVLEGNSLPEARAMLRQLREEMNNTDRSTKEGEASYKALSVATGRLTEHVRGLSREQKGLSYEVNKSDEQLASFSAHITLVANGVASAYQLMSDAGKKAFDIMLKGAEFQNLYDKFIEFEGGIENANKTLSQFQTAAAGGMDDAELIKYSNTMKSLGYNTTTTTKILDFAERRSDELGTTIEGANDILLRFFETGKGKGLYQYGIDVGDVNKKMSEMTGLTEKQIKELDTEIATRLRSDATLALYGNSLDDINNKQKDNADKLQSLNTTFKNLATSIGQFVVPAFIVLIKPFEFLISLTKDATINFASVNQEMLKSQKVSENTKRVLDELNISAQNMAEAYKGIENAIISMTAAQVESAKKFVIAEITKIKAMQETWKVNERLRIEALGLSTYEAQQRGEQVSAQITQFTDVGANLDKLENLLSQLDSREQLLNDLKTTQNKTGNGSISSEDNISKENVLIKQIEQRLALNKNLQNYTREQIELDKQALLNLANSIDSNSKDIKQLELKNKLLETYNKLVTEFGSLPKDITTLPGAEPDINTTPERTMPDYSFEDWNTKRIVENEERQKQEASAQKTVDTFGQGIGIAEQISNILGIGADTFGAKFIGWLQSGFSLINNIIGFISGITNMSSGGIFSLLGLSTGTDNWPGGWALVGDNAGKPTPFSEVAYLAPGSKVIPNRQSMDLLSLIKYTPLSSGTGHMDLDRFLSVTHAKNNTPNINVQIDTELIRSKFVKVVYETQGDVNLFANNKEVQ